MRLLRCAGLIAVGTAMAGCVSAPPAQAPAPLAEYPAPVHPDVLRAVERHRAQASKFEDAGDRLGAGRHWQVVLLLRPGDPQAAVRLAALRRAMAETVNDQLLAAREARRRGDVDQAQLSLLRVLAYDPTNDEAVGALREIDRQRAMRRAAERAMRAKMEESAAAARSRGTRRPAPTEAADYDLEQSLELLKAGDAKVAVAELRRYAMANPRDRAGRERIAAAMYAQARQLQRQGADAAAVEMHAEAIRLHPTPPREWTSQLAQLRARLASQEYEQGVRKMATDVPAAIAHFEAALRFAPDHTQAQLRLDRARRMQLNLRGIAPQGGN